ncbi:MAG: type VI secretion system membrane subunit TssM, partial [Gammaproteobacteria bacterium]|nr:type VI secretion system membrane subunit TssM [Gammaproteobacteria bacterium]
MKRVIEFFKDRRVISVIGLLALAFVIWFGGGSVRFGESNYAPLGSEVSRLTTIMVLMLAWGLNNLRANAHRNKQNKELIQDIEESQQQGAGPLTDQSHEELTVLRERFTQALQALKKLKFKGKHGSKAVYELPWYIIIGPPGSGKTTALVNSGLEFPLAGTVGKGALKGIGGTRNCDWWFTNDAVLIDTAGRYTTQDSHRVVDSAAWHGFLGLLKRNRPRRPINGAIIAISVADLLIQTEEQRNQHARTIRSRIDELMEELGVRFPIYVMFTKCDLVCGFSEFFEDLSRAEREQVWGVTFRDVQAASLAADIDWFAGEYNLLIDRLNDRLLWRMHQERDLNRRGAIEVFPQQMEILKPVLTNFLKQVFASSRYHLQPYLRGAYFSSGTQDGTPIDRMMSVITSTMGLPRESAQLPVDQGKSYFINQLFNGIIFPEAEIAGINQKFERAMVWMRRGGYAALAAVFVALVGVWISSIISNKSLLREIEAGIERFNQEKFKVASARSDIHTTLPALNALRDASQVYDQEEHPWLVRVGMYDPSVDEAAKKAYDLQLQLLFLPRIQRYLAHEIQQLMQQPDKKGELYEAFRFYYMFQEVQHMEPEQIAEWFDTRWETSLHGQASIKSQLTSHLKSLLAQQLDATELDKQFIARSRKELLKVPPSHRIYSRVRTSPNYARKVDLNNLFGDVLNNGFTSTSQSALMLPVLFTRDGYDDVDLSAESEVISAILKDNWVLGDKANVDFRKEDLDGISKEVNEYYLKEYSTRWRQALSSIKVAEFTSLQQAVDVLTVFADPVYSPIVNILKTTSTHTGLNLQAMLEVPGENSDKSLIKSASNLVESKLQGNQVDMTFKDLNKLTWQSPKQPAPVEKILQSVEDVRSYLNEISISASPGKAAYTVAKTRFQSNEIDAIRKLRAIAAKAPEPMDDWLYTIADQSWKVTLNSAKQHINSEWRSLVASKYQHALANRFPMSEQSQQELTLTDFSDFFKTGGTLDAFVQEYINPFVDVPHKWRAKNIDKRSMYFSGDSINQLQRAETIRKIFFRANPEAPGIRFQIRPVSMDKSVARFELDMGGQQVAYSHGPKFWQDVSWPGQEETDFVRIRFVGIDDNDSLKD